MSLGIVSSPILKNPKKHSMLTAHMSIVSYVDPSQYIWSDWKVGCVSFVLRADMRVILLLTVLHFYSFWFWDIACYVVVP